MDGPGFDHWTRRHFGLAAGGFAASALALLGVMDGEAGRNARKRKRRRKKRCKKLHARCQVGGKRKCCGELRCRTSSLNAGIHTFCCKTEGKPCENEFDCCDPLLCCPTANGNFCTPGPACP
jgi:hypothetical protein